MTATLPRDRAIAHQRTAADPLASSWVAASAGTGKTRVLTDRVLRLLLAGTEPQHVLCLTFTKAAAAEMATRLARTLSGWAVMDEGRLDKELVDLTGALADDEMRSRARTLFARVLDAPGGIKIQTIHAFCQALLKRFPLEAGVPPHFEVMEERDAIELLSEAQREVLADAAAAGEAHPIVTALAGLTAHVGEQEFAELMAELASERSRLRRAIDGAGGLEPLLRDIYAVLDADPERSEADIVRAAGADPAIDEPGLRVAAAAMLEGGKIDRAAGGRIAEWLAIDVEGRAARFADYLEAYFTEHGEGTRRDKLITKGALKSAPGADAVLAAEAERLAVVRRDVAAATVARASADLLRLAAAMLDAYERRKRARAFLDFDDLILAVRELLSERAAAAWVLFKLDGGIDHVLIDEAQDTNPDQWQVVRALTEEFFAGEGAHEERAESARTVFAVGDAKQSIYSFQRADPRAFAEMRGYFAERVTAARQAWNPVALDVSFRSTSAVLEAVDAVFAQSDARDGLVFAGEAIHHEADRAALPGLVELWPPVKPQPVDVPAPWSPPTRVIEIDSPMARLAARIAATIRGWLDKKELLVSKGRAIQPGDVMVLVRRRGPFVEEMVRALKKLDIAVAGVDRMVLTQQLAVMDLVALGNFVLLPEDDLTLACVLKGPLIGFDEDALFRVAHGRGGKSLWQALGELAAHDGPCARAHDYLAALLARADFAPPYEFYADVLDAGGGRKAIAARLGREAEDALDEFMGLALNYERVHAPSLQGFLQWFQSAETEVKRDLEQGARDEVRVMTVHGAKGLEAPIVFLADTMAMPPGRRPLILWPEQGAAEGLPLWAPRRALEREVFEPLRQRAASEQEREYRRLLYVAMTRAADRLYVCGWETQRAPSEKCWYKLIARGLDGLGAPLELDFGGGWAGEGRRHETGSPEAGPEPELALEEPEPPLPAWAETPPPPEPAPPRPFAPSRGEGAEPPVRPPLGPDEGYRFRRGLLIHRLLQSLPDLAPAARRAAGLRYLEAPVNGVPRSEAEALLDEALKVIENPAHAALFGPASLAEAPVAGVIGTRVISGQIDRLAVTEAEVLIVDYKTNRPPPARPEDVPPLYLGQLAAYRAVLAEVYPGRIVHCFLLWTDGPSLIELPPALLDPHAP